MTLLTAKELKEQSSIVDILERLGHKPVKKSGKEHIYKSMLREGDNTPSFTVDDRIGAWYDHGTGKGGNIIDFGLIYWKHLSFEEVVAKLQDKAVLKQQVSTGRPRKAVKVPHYIIESVKPIGTHPAITTYLKSRCVFDLAVSAMKELYYLVENERGERKHFFAAGWKNENDSWEVRNKYFKGCLGHKGMTFVPDDNKRLAVFEGYINYLSWKQQNPSASHSVLIINTLSLLALAIERAKSYSFIDLFMDRDPPGHAAAKEFIKTLPYATDRSEAYEGFNDYNDKLVDSVERNGHTVRQVDNHKRSYSR